MILHKKIGKRKTLNDRFRFYIFVLAILTFVTPIFADFTVDDQDVCDGEDASFSANCIGDVTSFIWEFEGGDPETSDEENPTVFYNTPGNWDVTLNVNGDDGDTYTVENYIEIFEIPDVTQDPFEIACKQIDKANEYLKLDEGLIEFLKQPLRIVEVSLPVKMDDGRVEMFTGYRG